MASMVIRPALVWVLGLLVVASFVLSSLAFGLDHPIPLTIRVLGGLLASMLTLALCLEIGFEYRQSSLMRFAWVAFAADAGISAVRWTVHAAQAYEPGTLADLSVMVLIALALICSLLGMSLTCAALAKIRLGFRLLVQDYIALAFLTAALMFVFGVRWTTLTGWHSLAIVVLFVATAVSIVLRRFTRQMAGGQLAATVRWLIVYLMLRCVLNVVSAANTDESLPLLHLARTLNCAMPWAFALAAAVRGGMIASAARQIRQIAVDRRVLT